jgi:hypothetical protein
MKKHKFLFFTISLLLVVSCNLNLFYEPSIKDNLTDENIEIRLTLPNGESKVIDEFDELICEKGVKCKHTNIEKNKAYLNPNQKSYKIFKTFYYKLMDDNYYIFYLYKKEQNVLVLKEVVSESNAATDWIETIFQNNVNNIKSDRVNKINNYLRKKIIYENDDDSKYKIEFDIQGNDITIKYLDNNIVTSKEQAIIFKNAIYNKYDNGCFSKSNYELNTDNICYGIDGGDVCHSKVAEVINGKTTNYFNGIKLNPNEKVVKLKWRMENETNLTSDYSDDGPRFKSNLYRVPSGKYWVLIYINENYYDKYGELDFRCIPYLYVSNKKLKWTYGRKFSECDYINFETAKIQNLMFYFNQSIVGVSSFQKRESYSEFDSYEGELWFLELSNIDDIKDERIRYELDILKSENEKLSDRINKRRYFYNNSEF